MQFNLKPVAGAVGTALMMLAMPAFAADTAAEPTEAAAQTGKKRDTDAEKVVITASKRAQVASKVPYNVTAIGEQVLREEQITDAKKLIQQSIGISAPDNSARLADSVTVRGLNVSPVNANNLESFTRSTLAYYLDDTPLPNMGYRIKDVARVETLLGPQGTLYGAGSLGGTVRYITNKPQLGKNSFSAHMGASHTKGAGGITWDNDIVINKAIGENFALRASLANLNEQGYTDRMSNPPWRKDAASPASKTSAWTPSPNANQNLYADDDFQEVSGGRLSALWRVSPGFEVLVAHAEQSQLAHGLTGASLLPLDRACAGLNPCPYKDRYSTPFAVNDSTVLGRYEEYADRDFKLDSIDVDLDLSFARLHSSTSKFRDTRAGQADYANQGFAYYGWMGHGEGSGRSAYMTFDNTYEGISHETRLVSKDSGPLSWIAGYYYTKQDKSLKFSEMLPGLDTTGDFFYVDTGAKGRLTDEGYREDLASTYTEHAVFGEATYRLTDAWQVTGGARVFNYEDQAKSLINDYTGFTNGYNNAKTAENGKSYFKFNTSYQLTGDMLAYFTYSQGFRRGGVNGFKTPYKSQTAGWTKEVRPDVLSYQPDSTDNMELGLKGYLFDRQLYLETNVYRIDWNDVQTYFSQSIGDQYTGEIFPINGTTNGPKAYTQGWEFSARYKLNDNWSFSYSTATTEGKWDETATKCMYVGDNTTGCRTWEKGGVLGGAPKWKHNFGTRFSTTLDDGTNLHASLSARHTGKIGTDRSDSVDDNSTLRYRPAYTLFNANVGMSRDDWSLGLWVQNLANKRVEVSAQEGGVMGVRLIQSRPRTIGMNFSYWYN
ncbi:TonB-dependent receptor [Chitinimonas sp. BJYL2]|uniref:TonB-dependent receptor n=1 Tax=Chitinimonas sp. BJYL2 TaxID=2976696 RepID=UPI0022B40791|nr:TonB-dependent receptor [Chitinimonas sp. BJYL2]